MSTQLERLLQSQDPLASENLELRAVSHLETISHCRSQASPSHGGSVTTRQLQHVDKGPDRSIELSFSIRRRLPLALKGTHVIGPSMAQCNSFVA